ncbi:MAG: U32 family peptidase [Candidatus Methanomethylophilus sp.]|nr:U32 family peptidase [Methanomethylophilus sp.]MDD3233464.1 U32 family peptidase [Methanomethylophilus sp.]MDD4222300.1 U32 family peptidase [Methanomethylophilus sp.]
MEILSPAGSKEGLVAAIKGGADAVYLGGKVFGARAFSDNFTDKELEGAVGYAHDRHVRAYVTVNTLIKDRELDDAVSFVKFLADIGADAVLIQDLGLLKSLHAVDIRKHASTQMGIHSAAGLKWCAENGISRAVLNRELTFEELAQIVPDSPVETEVFVQGALCYCLSGGCLFSSVVGGRSGNRGQCAQPCRKRYTADGTTGYKLSNADLYAVKWLPKLKELGVTSAKIEGRMRSQAYAYLATRVYAAANRGDDPASYAADDALLKTVFNRGFAEGYFGGVVSPVQQQYADNRGFCLGQAQFQGRHFDTTDLKEPVAVRDGISLYQGDTKVGGFKLSSLGRAAAPFDVPDGTYDVYRTYDPRIDVIKNLVGDPPRLTGTHERPRLHVQPRTVIRKKVKLPEMSFYVSSLRNLQAVLPYADRVYFEMNDSLTEARQLCARADVECVTLAPRFLPLGDLHTDGYPLMINTPGQYLPQEGDRVYASYFMNTFNAELHQPFWQTTLSVELSKDEIKNLAAHYPGRLEVMAFGRTELMCTRDPGMRNGILQDERTYRFPVYKDGHGLSHILNSTDLMLLPYLQEIGSFGVESVGIDVRKRPETLAAAVAQAYAEDNVRAKTSLVEMCGGINYGAYLRGTD